MKDKGGYSFGKDERDKNLGGSEIGPGNYDPKFFIGSKNYKLKFKCNCFKEGGKNGFSFGGEKKGFNIDNETGEIGPGQYNFKQFLSKKYGKFGRQKRKAFDNGELDIGPGQYNPNNPNFKGRNGWTMAKKYRNKDQDEIPGPGNYNDISDLKYKKFKKRGIKFGRDKRKGLGIENSVPGPGYYNYKTKFKGGYSIGNSKRKGEEIEEIPGPGAYNPEDFRVINLKIIQF